MSPTTASKPRFLQSPAQRDRSKSLSVDRSPSATSSASHATSNSASTLSSGGGGRRSAGRFLGLGKPSKKEARDKKRQRIREAERGAPPLRTQKARTAAPRARMRPERHFSPSTLLSSSGHSSSSHGAANDTLQLARTPSCLGVDGPLAARLSGWFAHLAGSTSDLSLAGTISHTTQLASSASATSRTAICSATSRKPDSASTSTSRGALLQLPHAKTDAAVPKPPCSTRLYGTSSTTTTTPRPTAARSPSSSWALFWTPRASSPPDAGKLDDASFRLLYHTSKFHLDSTLHPDSVKSSNHQDHEDNISADWTPSAEPSPAASYAVFYAQVWCTYRAGFEPIHDLPGLSALPQVGGDAGVGGGPCCFDTGERRGEREVGEKLEHKVPAGMCHSPSPLDSS
ncbi:hypothetical protein B0H10DRAFT_2211288 [Mycena sp. CBHHK59/15]|nr:hypothetical protein B0H10DRAFT_2211288 [Mycena sp. CBHHK59/15]